MEGISLDFVPYIKRYRDMEVKDISVDLIDEAKTQIRSFMTREKLEELASSIKKVGVLQPLLVEKKGDRYEVIAGHRRLEASKMTHKATVPCLVVRMTKNKRLLAMGHENFHRENVNHMDVAHYLKMLKTEYELTNQKIADTLGYSVSWVNFHMRLLLCTGQIQAAVEGGQLEMEAGVALMGIKDPKDRSYYLEKAVQGGASQMVVRNWVQQYKSSTGEGSPQPSQSGALDKTTELPPLTFRCSPCQNVFPHDQMITIQTCPECYSALQKVFKLEREAGESEKEESKTD